MAIHSPAEVSRAGAAILAGSKAAVLSLAEEISLTHHECWDGTGHPVRLRGS
jgi:putative two-component system response regulator